MAPTRTSTDHLLPLLLVMVAATVLWYAHALAWDLGAGSPILSHDSAQVALAAREFVWHGRLASPFALPLDLVRHASPPWPLSMLPPGPVLVEAALFKLALLFPLSRGSDPRAWLTLLMPFMSFLLLGASAVLGARHLLARYAPEAPHGWRVGAPAVLGFMVVLDAEAQHFALSGVGDLPYAVLLLAVLLGVARGAGVAYPWAFGGLLGVAALFRADGAWLVPLAAMASAWCAPAGRRGRVAGAILLAAAVVLVPWWLHQWWVFGTLDWDLGRYAIWDRVQGRTWFELYHRPQLPDVPHGADGVPLILAKVSANLGRLLPVLLSGPRGLWLGALVAFLALRPARPLAAAAVLALVGLGVELLVASATVPWLRVFFPYRVASEAAGLFALWALVQRLPGAGPRARGALCVASAVVALAWGGWLTHLAHGEASVTSRERAVPQSRSLTALSISLNEVLAPGETLMSNLGPALAWQTNHPVLHLADAPADVPACRARLDFRHVVLVFRSADRAWPAWQEIVERPGTAALVRELGVRRERRFETPDGFGVVWLELGPAPTPMAATGR